METKTNQHQIDVDTKLAELWSRESMLRDRLVSAKKSLASTIGLKGEWGKGRERRTIVYRESLEEVMGLAKTKLLDPDLRAWDSTAILQRLDKIVEIRDELRAVDLEAKPLEDEYRAAPWSRFFLVPGGHIHSSMHCSTCRPTTLFGWLPELSGLTEKDAVDAHGPLLCTVCFPTAPVEWTLGPKKEDENLCPGSGTSDFDRSTFRTSGWGGNGRAKCTHCNKYHAVTSTYKIRKHKKEV